MDHRLQTFKRIYDETKDPTLAYRLAGYCLDNGHVPTAPLRKKCELLSIPFPNRERNRTVVEKQTFSARQQTFLNVLEETNCPRTAYIQAGYRQPETINLINKVLTTLGLQHLHLSPSPKPDPKEFVSSYLQFGDIEDAAIAAGYKQTKLKHLNRNNKLKETLKEANLSHLLERKPMPKDNNLTEVQQRFVYAFLDTNDLVEALHIALPQDQYQVRLIRILINSPRVRNALEPYIVQQGRTYEELKNEALTMKPRRKPRLNINALIDQHIREPDTDIELTALSAGWSVTDAFTRARQTINEPWVKKEIERRLQQYE